MNGFARLDPNDGNMDMYPLLDMIIDDMPAPEVDENAPLAMQCVTIDHSNFVGRIGIGRVYSGAIHQGDKGTWADQAPENGPVYNVLIQNCTYGRVHGCLTLGSESVKDRNIVLRNIKVGNAQRVLWHKDADKYGNFIINKHKSDVGIFIPWKELSK
jgi:translation elongation factor EF-4